VRDTAIAVKVNDLSSQSGSKQVVYQRLLCEALWLDQFLVSVFSTPTLCSMALGVPVARGKQHPLACHGSLAAVHYTSYICAGILQAGFRASNLPPVRHA